MRAFPCQCGKWISFDGPSQSAGYLVWDADVDASIYERQDEIESFFLALKEGTRTSWIERFYGSSVSIARFNFKSDADIIEDILSKHDHYTRVCLSCLDCGSLFLEEEPGTRKFVAYVKR